MSVRASPLKSPISTICQLGSGDTAPPFWVTTPPPTMVEPSISHSTSEPLALRHNRSALPSASKSPTPATVHDGSGATGAPSDVTIELSTIDEPFMVHSTSVPEVLRH